MRRELQCKGQFLVIMFRITISVTMAKTYKRDYNREVKDKRLL